MVTAIAVLVAVVVAAAITWALRNRLSEKGCGDQAWQCRGQSERDRRRSAEDR